MARRAIVYLAISLTSTGALLSACSGAEPQDVLLSASGSSSSSSSSGGTSGTASSSGTSGTSGTCPPEQEPNDNKNEANTLSPVRCGTLSRRDPRDYLTFRLKPDTKSMSINFTGRVRLRVDVEGHDTTVLTPDSAGIVPFVTDADYLVQVAPLTESNAELKWRVELVEK